MTATGDMLDPHLQSLFPDPILAGILNGGPSTEYSYSLQSVSIFPLILSGQRCSPCHSRILLGLLQLTYVRPNLVICFNTLYSPSH